MFDTLLTKLRTRRDDRQSTAASQFDDLVALVAGDKFGTAAKDLTHVESVLAAVSKTPKDLETAVERFLAAGELSTLAGEFETRRLHAVELRSSIAKLDDSYAVASQKYRDDRATLAAELSRSQAAMSESGKARNRLAGEFSDTGVGAAVAAEDALREAAQRVEVVTMRRDAMKDEVSRLTNDGNPTVVDAERRLADVERELSDANVALVDAENAFSKG